MWIEKWNDLINIRASFKTQARPQVSWSKAVLFHYTWNFQTLSFWGLYLHAQSCLTLCDPMDSSPPGSSVHGILQARILEWAAIPFLRGSSQPRNQTRVSFIEGRFFTIWTTREDKQLYILRQFFFICLWECWIHALLTLQFRKMINETVREDLDQTKCSGYVWDVTSYYPRSKRLLISWLQSPSAMILEPKKDKAWHCFHCFPVYLPWSNGTRCHELSFLTAEF